VADTDKLLPADESLERFDAGCDSSLKFFDAPESYLFGQFVDLLVDYSGGNRQLTLGTRAGRGEITIGRQHTAMAVPLAGAPREAAVAASFPLEALGQPDHGAIEPGPQPPAVVEIDVDAFVADPTITVDGEQVTVTLPEVSVRTLLDAWGARSRSGR
jgi:hypothetical protein